MGFLSSYRQALKYYFKLRHVNNSCERIEKKKKRRKIQIIMTKNTQMGSKRKTERENFTFSGM
jgi:hypothetical protein